MNQKTKQPVESSISYEYLPGGEEAGIAQSNPVTGDYKIVLPYGKKYGFSAKAPDYISVSDNIDLSDLSQYKEIKRDLYLAPIEVGEIIRLNNVFFDFNKYVLRQESFPELERIIQFLKQNTFIEIEIAGHTDNVGSDAYNLELSFKRAAAVKEYVISKEINGKRIITKGYGKSKPVDKSDTEEGRQLNRRVEFIILKNK